MYGRLSLVVLLSSAFLCGMEGETNKSLRKNHKSSSMISSAGELPVGSPEEPSPIISKHTSDLVTKVVSLLGKRRSLEQGNLEGTVVRFLSDLRKESAPAAMQTGRGGGCMDWEPMMTSGNVNFCYYCGWYICEHRG